MKLRDIFTGFRNVKQSAVQQLISMQALGAASWSNRQYKDFSEEAYKRNIVCYRAINEVASGAAQAPWTVYRVDAKGERVEGPNHPLAQLMARPNPRQGTSAFIEFLVAYYLLSGNTYIEGVAATGKPPSELYTHRPDRMSIIKGPTGPRGFEYTVNGATKKWVGAQSEDVLHLKTFNPLDDWYGMSPVEAAAYSVDTHNSTLEWNKALLDNRAQPSGAMVYNPKEGPATLEDTQYNRLKSQLDEQYTGAKNAGRPMLLEGGLDWKQMGMSPQDMDYINSKHTNSRDIALAFGVPPMLLGIPGDNTYSNMKEARLALWEQTILPILYKVRDELNVWLAPKFGDDVVLGIDEDKISALNARRDLVWDRMQGAQFLTINEKRKAVGYEAVDDGDQVLVPAAMLPLGFDPETDGEGNKQQYTEWLTKECGYNKRTADELTKLAYGDE